MDPRDSGCSSVDCIMDPRDSGCSSDGGAVTTASWTQWLWMQQGRYESDAYKWTRVTQHAVMTVARRDGCIMDPSDPGCSSDGGVVTTASWNPVALDATVIVTQWRLHHELQWLWMQQWRWRSDDSIMDPSDSGCRRDGGAVTIASWPKWPWMQQWWWSSDDCIMDPSDTGCSSDCYTVTTASWTQVTLDAEVTVAQWRLLHGPQWPWMQQWWWRSVGCRDGGSVIGAVVVAQWLLPWWRCSNCCRGGGAVTVAVVVAQLLKQ